MSALIIIMFPVHFTQLNKQLGKQARGGVRAQEELLSAPSPGKHPRLAFMGASLHLPLLCSFIRLSRESLIHSLGSSFIQIIIYSSIHLFTYPGNIYQQTNVTGLRTGARKQ